MGGIVWMLLIHTNEGKFRIFPVAFFGGRGGGGGGLEV